MPWAMNVLWLKIDEEMKAYNFPLSDGACGVIHVLRLKSRTATMLKVGASQYPSILARTSRLKKYESTFKPMVLEKVEAIHLYQNTRRAYQIEEELHQNLRVKYGNVNPHSVKSRELYKVGHLEAILELLHEIEQKPSFNETIPQKRTKGNEHVLRRSSGK